MGGVTAARRLRFEVARSTRRSERAWPALALLMLVAACGRPAATDQKVPAAGEWRTFEGNWTASGTRTSLDLGSDHRASIVHMNGSLLLTGDNALGVGFRAEFVGFTDTPERDGWPRRVDR